MSSVLTQKNGDILVSVYCMTYNHADTVSKTIESILSQKTDFAFELIIHDDASTDGTAEIVREYEKNHPDIIRAILQTENQYRKCNIYKQHMNPAAKGRYVAVCEGDDYWTDDLKLQKQLDYMIANSDCTMCFHAVQQLSGDGELTVVRPLKQSGKVFTQQIIKRGGLFCPTVSLVFRRDVVENWPQFREMADVYDYPLQILSSLMGSVFYIDEVMGVYRFAVKDSWTAQRQNVTDYTHLENETEWVNKLDEFTNGRYKDAINYHLAHLYLTEYRKNFDKSVKLKAKGYIRSLPLKNRFVFKFKIIIIVHTT